MESDLGPRFACDAMLGGLARWLRAAGYEASWNVSIADPDLVRLAQAEGRTLLSSDHGVFEFAVVRDGVLPSLFVPLRLSPEEQLAFVLARLALPLRQPRCMACGGSLIKLPRERAEGRVPPRSLAWAHAFCECSGCGRAFWHGRHWDRIAAQLRLAAEARE
jgi:uncharacterized protein with PIN domain